MKNATQFFLCAQTIESLSLACGGQKHRHTNGWCCVSAQFHLLESGYPVNPFADSERFFLAAEKLGGDKMKARPETFCQGAMRLMSNSVTAHKAKTCIGWQIMT